MNSSCPEREVKMRQ